MKGRYQQDSGYVSLPEQCYTGILSYLAVREISAQISNIYGRGRRQIKGWGMVLNKSPAGSAVRGVEATGYYGAQWFSAPGCTLESPEDLLKQ